MYSALKPGLAIKAKSNRLNQSLGIDAAASQGHIRKADEDGISVYIQRGNNRGWLEVVMTPDTFASNFEEDRGRADDISGGISRHFSKRYPEDCV